MVPANPTLIARLLPLLGLLVLSAAAPGGASAQTGPRLTVPSGFPIDVFGYKVVLLRFRDGKPVSVEDFVTGWLEGSSSWGRPVDVLVGRDGALYVSDQGAGRIYRVRHRS